jgi:hypothetical protein
MWWFELPDMLHKLILTSLLRFIKVYQVALALAVVGLYTLIILVYRPYLTSWDDTLHLLDQVAIFSLLLSGRVLMEGPLEGSAEMALSVLLSGLVILILLAFVLRAIVFFRTLIQKRRRKALLHLASGRRDLSFLKGEPFSVSNSAIVSPSLNSSPQAAHLDRDPYPPVEGVELEPSHVPFDPVSDVLPGEMNNHIQNGEPPNLDRINSAAQQPGAEVYLN